MSNNEETGLTSWDVEFCERMIHGNKNAGQLVETKTGKLGQTKSSDPMVNGKVLVYLLDGTKLACDPNNLKLKGFID